MTSQNMATATSLDNLNTSPDFEKNQDHTNSDVPDIIDQECIEYDPEEFPPITLSYIVGINGKLGIKIINRTPNEHYCIYSLGHVASLLNLTTKAIQHFQGHETALLSIEHDRKGRFVETADQESVILWDLNELGKEPLLKLRTLHRPFGDVAQIAAVGMSSCGRYLVVASEKTEKDTLIQFWRWSFGLDDSDSSFQISEEFGNVRSIRFSGNPGENEFFAITLEFGVVFACWNSENNQLEVHTPQQKKFGTLCQSCYIPGRHTVASVTAQGHVVIWGDYLTYDRKVPITNRKNFIKMLNIQHSYKIFDIKEIDGMLVTYNEAGQICFYDVEIRLLYTCIRLQKSSILYLAPVMVPKEIKLIDADDFDPQEDENVQIVYKSTCPVNYTLEKNPFLVRDFYVVDKAGHIICCSILNNEFKTIKYRKDDSLVSFDSLQNNPWVICAKSNDNIFFGNHENNTVDSEATSSITCICKSADGTSLAVGYSNGAIWMIDPANNAHLTPGPLCFSKKAILHMIFSSHPALAYADADSTITLLQYDKDTMEWQLSGKYRYHNKPIILLHIVQTVSNGQSLIALGEDRLYFEYDLEKSIQKSSLHMKRNAILEQVGEFTIAIVIRLSQIVAKDTSTNGNVILVADNQYKFKIFDLVTLDRLFMFCGPIFKSPIRVILNFSESHKFYNKLLIIATERTLGCIVLPIDGNMYRYTGIAAHPQKINMLIPYKTDIIVCNEKELGGMIWRIHKKNIMQYFKSGGEGLIPFCKFIPGGKEGWLFKEMIGMFYYMQIMAKGPNAPQEHTVAEFIPIEDLPDYVRGIGFFASEYEIQCLLREATNTTSPSIPPTTIDFQDAVLLYLNHKPIAGYNLEDMKVAVEYLANSEESLDIDSSDDVQITRDRILKVMTTRGESVSVDMAKRYLVELLGHKTDDTILENRDIDKELEALPEIFNVAAFCSDLLGVKIKSKPKDAVESQAEDQDEAVLKSDF